MECALCGLPAGSGLQHDGLAFCCTGCLEVYRHFGQLRCPDGDAPPTLNAPAADAAAGCDGAEAYLRVDGMHCASCEILIERLALQIDGVLAATTNYATATARIVYDPDRLDPVNLPRLLSRSGYRARFSGEAAPEHDNRMPVLRLVTAESVAATVMMLYLAFYYPVHLGVVDIAELEPVRWLVYRAVPFALFALTTVLVVYVASPIFRGAWIGLRTGVLNMDDLLALAILAAYGFSIGELLAGGLELYFDVAATIIAVVTIGRYLERDAKANATEALARIMDSWVPLARVRRGGEMQRIGIGQLQPAEHVYVEPGEVIPADGVIVDGRCAIDESLMTGEPFPISRGIGDRVLGGTRNVEGSIVIDVGNVVSSQLENLARVLWSAQSASDGAVGMGDRVARFFVPTVTILALLVGIGFYATGSSTGSALLAAMATLIVSCPCTFGLAIPLTTAVGVNNALRNGIIMASGDAFEKASQVDTVAIDKTGILSTGQMRVVDVIGPPEVAEYAAAVERLSSHPIAEAIACLDTRYAARDFENHPGKGALAEVAKRRVAVGSRSLFGSLGWEIPRELVARGAAHTVVSYVGWDGMVHGAIITRDQPRRGWEQAIAELRQLGPVTLLTGAESAGGFGERFDMVFCGIPPEGKASVIRRLKADGVVAMIGDGSNDAPSLAEADLGIAFGAPTALAADAADLIIPGDGLDRIFVAFEILRVVRRRIRQNLVWALLYNAIAIPVAISGHLNPLFAALAMSASSLLVIWNSSRSHGLDGSGYEHGKPP